MITEKVEAELIQNYSDEMGRLVMYKLRTLIRQLNFNTHKKSIAIYVSPVFEKVLYFDIEVEEKIKVDDSFQIRDIVYSKKQSHSYLVLHLGCRKTNLYLGSSGSFTTLISSWPKSICSYINNTTAEW